MAKKDIKDILEKLPNGSDDKQTKRIVKLWIFQLNNKTRAEISESELERLKAESWERLNRRIISSSSRIRLWPRILGAAAATALIVLGGYFLYYNGKTVNSSANLIVKNIAPGRLGATLTLASGKQIRLGDVATGQLANEAGISIKKTADGQLVYEINDSDTEINTTNILSTANGETYQVRLPDGSTVDLNAGSRITYPTNFTKEKNRRITLSGEAYFHVAKDKKHPFIVTTDQQEVAVLGTDFNINAYNDEPDTKTTLLEGSVRVSTIGDQSGYVRILSPGQQAIYTGKGRINVKEADTDEAVAWRNGFFIFENENIETAMRKVSRWYNVDIVFKQEEIKKEIFGGSVSRSENINTLLRVLSKAANVNMKVEGKSIMISKK